MFIHERTVLVRDFTPAVQLPPCLSHLAMAHIDSLESHLTADMALAVIHTHMTNHPSSTTRQRQQ